jgi:hypothetical protein
LKDRNGDKILVGSRVKVEYDARIKNGVYMPGDSYRGFVSSIENEYLIIDVSGKLKYTKPEYTETVRVTKHVRERYEKRTEDLAAKYKKKIRFKKGM